ncbi:hypothetical protein ACEZ3G_10440 [Maribacter algicola]|uniref:Uncharacterized protein n=1 Tax=Meishania litoralis TaxID=3434685 RepID=A0ACC7LLH7_9FLAO
MTIPEYFRQISVNSLFGTATLRRCWPTWKARIHQILGENYNETDIINLGDHLSDIFKSTGGEGRGQGQLSGGGTAWESLVCWYINLCTVGSRTVAIRKMSLVPKPIQDAITVNYGNFACNTESDITVITFPDLPNYGVELDELNVGNNGIRFDNFRRNKFNREITNFLASQDFDNYEIGVIQCKTNWNDNAQIPMLWDMIYSANGFRGRNITIGRDGFNIHDTNNFTYSFVTVPSNQRANYNSDSVAVKRVTNLSGGNYWGKPTEQHVARSLKEIFTNNFQAGYPNNIRTEIRAALEEFSGNLSYFDII